MKENLSYDTAKAYAQYNICLEKFQLNVKKKNLVEKKD